LNHPEEGRALLKKKGTGKGNEEFQKPEKRGIIPLIRTREGSSLENLSFRKNQERIMENFAEGEPDKLDDPKSSA